MPRLVRGWCKFGQGMIGLANFITTSIHGAASGIVVRPLRAYCSAQIFQLDALN